MNTAVLEVNEEVLARTVERCQEKKIILPTIAMMRDPKLIPTEIVEALPEVGMQDINPLNLYRISWYNDPETGKFKEVPTYVELPSSLTGVKARILVMVGKNFPTGAHKAYRNKEDFGDMDVLIMNEGLTTSSLRDLITDAFHPQDIHTQPGADGGILSFDFRELQIDFILTLPVNWDSAYNFFKWNDMGNFIGKVAYKLSLSYGTEGLVYHHHTENRILGKVNISRDPSRILPLLGFDYERWVEGFDTPLSIYEYIASGKYFNAHSFKIERLGRRHRNRNRRRKLYMDFVQYLTDRGLMEEGTEPECPLPDPKTNREGCLRIVDAAFPEVCLLDRIAEMEETDRLAQERHAVAHAKFNGNLVQERYGLEKGDLGQAMKAFTIAVRVDGATMDDYLIDTPEEEVWALFERVRPRQEGE
ncbi:hypothetical protein KIPB_006661 [Kipferlia bialata]|uniref:Uncharacterized protein n=1 Tax=Kipferlia bialata TaxID=797122 RepID=A0A9K3CXK7_9EUKA|nr:hypothetical protein KIPB_006661 [Kipferlia bialata]|eukprot:g6661.t1